jgi:hypothetical protein
MIGLRRVQALEAPSAVFWPWSKPDSTLPLPRVIELQGCDGSSVSSHIPEAPFRRRNVSLALPCGPCSGLDHWSR